VATELATLLRKEILYVVSSETVTIVSDETGKTTAVNVELNRAPAVEAVFAITFEDPSLITAFP
jgi:hypothetical protein